MATAKQSSPKSGAKGTASGKPTPAKAAAKKTPTAAAPAKSKSAAPSAKAAPAGKAAAAVKSSAATKSAAKPAATKAVATKAAPTKAPTKAAPAKAAAPAKPAASKPSSKQDAPAAKPASTKPAATKPAPAKEAAAKQAPAKAAAKPAAAPAPAPAPAPEPRKVAEKKPVKKATAAPTMETHAVKGVTKDGIAYTKDFDAKFLAAMRTLLNEERISLVGQAGRLEEEANALIEEQEMGDVQFDDEGGEGDTMVVERSRDLVLSAQARQTVTEIDAALERITLGTYGYSVQSGRPLPRERLEAIPWATVLVEEKVGGIGRR
jgi:RNA polymerase-binding transcription factor DksA